MRWRHNCQKTARHPAKEAFVDADVEPGPTPQRSGEAVRYVVAQNLMAKVVEWNETLNPLGRYDAVMKAENLFEVPPPGDIFQVTSRGNT